MCGDGHCACSTGETSTTDDAVRASGTTTVFEVTGMTCSHCEQAVGSAVSAVSGVTSAKADASTGLITVISDGELDDDLIRAAVDDAGYELAGRAAQPAAN
jgi:copper chaperone CopZ